MEPAESSKPANEDPDYYWENGLMVFTKKYHLARGYCCQNGCRHCPYGFIKEKLKLPDDESSG